MKLTVIVADAAHAVHVGGEVERYTKTFDAPPELAEFIAKAKHQNGYASVSIAIEADGETP